MRGHQLAQFRKEKNTNLVPGRLKEIHQLLAAIRKGLSATPRKVGKHADHPDLIRRIEIGVAAGHRLYHKYYRFAEDVWPCRRCGMTRSQADDLSRELSA